MKDTKAPSVGEDTDIQYRLELYGVKIKSINNIAVQYHLHHTLLSRPEKNLELFGNVKSSGNYFTPFGIEKNRTIFFINCKISRDLNKHLIQDKNPPCPPL